MADAPVPREYALHDEVWNALRVRFRAADKEVGAAWLVVQGKRDAIERKESQEQPTAEELQRLEQAKAVRDEITGEMEVHRRTHFGVGSSVS